MTIAGVLARWISWPARADIHCSSWTSHEATGTCAGFQILFGNVPLTSGIPESCAHFFWCSGNSGPGFIKLSVTSPSPWANEECSVSCVSGFARRLLTKELPKEWVSVQELSSPSATRGLRK